MALKLRYDGPPRGKWAAVYTEQQQAVARAVTTTFREAAKEIEQQGRANIGGAGFTRRWQAGFRVRVMPRQFSLSPRITGTHRINFANIFERGGSIKGRPLLWLPLPTAPRIAGKRATARAYVKNVGPLISINRPGKPPLLAGQTMRGRTGRRASLASLRTGARRAASGRSTALVPLFVGIRQVNLRRRFNVSPIYDRVRGQLGEMYLNNYQKTAT